jgi:drug/metabolite transporter (DMT)-like permease
VERREHGTVWVPLSIVTAVAFAASGSYAKALARRTHVFVVSWSLIVLALPWALVLLAHDGMPEVGGGFLFAALLSITLNMVAVTLQVKALSISPLSVTVPFLAFTPVFMLATSAIVLREMPDARGLTGILLVALGAYTVHLDRIRGGLIEPFRAIARERGSLLMLVVAFIWSWTAVYDKVAVLASSPAFYTSFFSLVFGVLYAPFLAFGLRKARPGPRILPRLFLLGAFGAVMILSQLAAIQLTLASYVIAVKRSGLVLSVVLGYLLFKEEHLRARLAGAVLMTLGVVVLSL